MNKWQSDLPSDPLKDREIEILHLMADGMTDGEIAASLYISKNTVKYHNKQIYRKLDVSSRREAVEQAQQWGLIAVAELPFQPKPKSTGSPSLIYGIVFTAIVALVAVVFLILSSSGPTASTEIQPLARQSLSVQPATALADAPAEMGEIVVVVAPFEQSGDITYTPEIDIVEVLQASPDELGEVRTILIDHPISDEDEAQAISDVYQASLVLYGRITPGGVTFEYQITPRGGQVVDTAAEDIIRISRTDVQNFDAFLFEGLASKYVLGLALGQLHSLEDDQSAAKAALLFSLNSLDKSLMDVLDESLLHFVLGQAYTRENNAENALAALDRAIELDPTNDNFYEWRAGVYDFMLDENEAALPIWDQAFRLRAKQVDSYDLLAEGGDLEFSIDSVNHQVHVSFSAIAGTRLIVRLEPDVKFYSSPYILLRDPEGQPLKRSNSGSYSVYDISNIILEESGTYTIVVGMQELIEGGSPFGGARLQYVDTVPNDFTLNVSTLIPKSTATPSD